MYDRNGAPMERALLQSLVDFLAYRGPDGRESWMEGSVGLGHAMFRTTRDSLEESQPASLEGRFWIVADARLDSREELTRELQRSGRVVRPSAPDSELLLHAYAAWGTACVEHLRGDFSFAIWDARNKQLFVARIPNREGKIAPQVFNARRAPRRVSVQKEFRVRSTRPNHAA